MSEWERETARGRQSGRKGENVEYFKKEVMGRCKSEERQTKREK